MHKLGNTGIPLTVNICSEFIQYWSNWMTGKNKDGDCMN